MNCQNFVLCPVPATFPLLGYNAEVADQFLVTAAGFGPITPPPLGWSFGLATGTAFAQASSVAAAEQAANAQAISNATVTWANPNGTPAYVPPDENIVDDDFIAGAPAIF